MTRIERERYKRTRYWPAGVAYYAPGFHVVDGIRYKVGGVGSTPRKARLDLLFQQDRRRFPPHE